MRNRRNVLGGLLATAAGVFLPTQGRTEGELIPTPALSRGPFYPRDPSGLPFHPAEASIPEPLTNDLTRTASGVARGRPIELRGRVIDVKGEPLAGAVVEIWSVNADDIYLVEDGGASDPGFAGFGATTTDADGQFAFRTIRPNGYDRYFGLIRRTAHIHVLVDAGSGEIFTSEVWFADESRNAIDSFFSRTSAPALRARMAVALLQRDGIEEAWFQIVLASRYSGRPV